MKSKSRDQKIQEFQTQVLRCASLVGFLKNYPSDKIALLESQVLYMDQIVKLYSSPGLETPQYHLLKAQFTSNLNWFEYNINTL
jgi:hypothetical protein